MPRRRSGFTLIELLIVIAISGILIGISVSKYDQITAHQKVVRSAEALTNSMRMAFTMAERKRKPVRLVFSTDKMSLLVSNRTYSKVYSRVAIGTKSEVGLEGIGLRKSQVAVYPSSHVVDVFPSGFASDSMVITLTGGTGSTQLTRKVRMTRAGMVIVQ